MKRIVLLFAISLGALLTMAVIPIHIDSLTCTGNEVYCTNLACSVEIIRKKMQVINFDCTFPNELNGILIAFTLFKKYGRIYRKFLIESTEDMCKVLDNTERSNLVSRMMPMWKYYGQFPRHCPIKGNVSVRRYPLDLSFYPTIFPTGSFKILIQIFESNNNTIMLNVTTAFKVSYS